MKISLLTDAPKHNLALMKLSAWHKQQGHEVWLNMPLLSANYTYASILFEKNINKFRADEYGGIGYEIQNCQRGISGNGLVNGRRKRKITKPNRGRISNILKKEQQEMFPDYGLYSIDFSLGYTFRPCLRKCDFCKVHKIEDDFRHYSIWDFHDPKFSKIELLNNNTFFDPQWKETFEEIWDADLTVIEHGFDLRLMNEEKADFLRRTKFQGQIHYAWDRMKDEKKVLEGLKIAPRGRVYVLIGYDTTQEEDLYRCQKIIDAGFDPYIMPYNQSVKEKRFKRFIDTFMWRKYKTIEEAWKDYRG